MKISDIRSYATMARQGRPWLFIVIETDEGVSGLGECSLYTGTRMVSETLQMIKPQLIGLDPSHIEEIWQRIFRRYLRIGARGIVWGVASGIDIALWDIKGKMLGAPIYQLLGGPVRDHVPLYTHVPDALNEQMTPQDAVNAALKARAEGFEAIKTDPFRWARQRSGPFQGATVVEQPSQKIINEAATWVSALRDALEPDHEIMVDAHARFDVASAIRAAQVLEPLNLTWFEEPVPPESSAALRQVREQTRIPICVGESLFTRYDFMPVLEGRLADYLMPDVAWTGGISELRRIAALAETYYVRVAPHFALGPVALMASFHVCMTTPNLYRQECFHSWFDDFKKVVTPVFDCHDGALWPSGAPGLGMELKMEGVAAYAVDPADPKANFFFI
jgi:galactonate dehydratase